MSVLVTGATGFIGREVVRRLLSARRPVVALARGRGGATARERVVAAIGSQPAAADLDVVDGDLVSTDCGLAGGHWRRLRATVETVINCAGDSCFEPTRIGPYVAAHIDGPLRLLEGLAGGRLARWAHVSTAFVCGWRTGTILERESDVGQTFHNPYERVKLEAERAIRAAGAGCGVDIRVFRPSIVVGAAPATTGGNPSNLLFRFIRMLAALARMPNAAALSLRVAAAPRAPFNIVPVEYVATAVVALAECPDGADETFHLVVREAPRQAVVLQAISGRLGLRGVSLVDARSEPLEDPSPFERAVARMLEPYRDYLAQDVRFDDVTAAGLLRRCRVERPVLSTRAVHRLVDLAIAADAGRAEPLMVGMG
ncbi:MAG TPA: SDR family oxidoreductase [Methylomirabilota bacterium]|nr:SDR family oxidoreductase [Methylomirabilota bacterium]